MSAADVTLEAVLEAYMLDATDDQALATYLARYPQFATELLDLVHESQRVLPDELPELDADGRTSIDLTLAAVMQSWPTSVGRRDLFAELKPADYGRLSALLGVPRNIIGAVRDGLAIIETIPIGWLRRFAEALNSGLDELRASLGNRSLAASYKSEERPADKQPVPFEQLLVEAQVSEARRSEIMSETE